MSERREVNIFIRGLLGTCLGLPIGAIGGALYYLLWILSREPKLSLGYILVEMEASAFLGFLTIPVILAIGLISSFVTTALLHLFVGCFNFVLGKIYRLKVKQTFFLLCPNAEGKLVREKIHLEGIMPGGCYLISLFAALLFAPCIAWSIVKTQSREFELPTMWWIFVTSVGIITPGIWYVVVFPILWKLGHRIFVSYPKLGSGILNELLWIHSNEALSAFPADDEPPVVQTLAVPQVTQTNSPVNHAWNELINRQPVSPGVLDLRGCNWLTSFHRLPVPSWVKKIDCRECDRLTSLGGLPEGIEVIDCSKSQYLLSLSGLPGSVLEVCCDGCTRLQNLKGLPPHIQKVVCRGCRQLANLEGLPNATRIVDCSVCNALRSLKGLPIDVKEVVCRSCPTLFNLKWLPRMAKVDHTGCFMSSQPRWEDDSGVYHEEKGSEEKDDEEDDSDDEEFDDEGDGDDDDDGGHGGSGGGEQSSLVDDLTDTVIEGVIATALYQMAEGEDPIADNPWGF